MEKRLYMVIFQVFQGMELFKSVDVYLVDSLEMEGHFTMTLGRDPVVTVGSYHGLCVQCDKVPIQQGTL